IINSTAETIVATGAVISSIPMIDGVDIDLLKDSDRVMLDADEGNVELLDVKIIESVSSVILIDGKILMLKRPITVRSFPGVWSLCAGKIERGETPEAAAVREIKEETGILVLKPLRYLLPIHVREKDIIWKVYPFLFKADGVVPNINSENDEFKLFDITELKELKLVEGTLDVIKRLVIDH
ncbi:MAG: NUDIX domain-containing protein, partial [Candidatus Methanomethylophilaceae archaeon]